MVREGGLEGSGSKEMRRTSRSSGATWEDLVEVQFISDSSPPGGEPRLMILGQSWHSGTQMGFTCQSDFENLNSLPMHKNQDT